MAAVGNQVYAGGSFSTVNGVDAPGIAKWNGTAWEPVGGGVDGEVYAITVSGNNVYIGGSFTQAGDADALNIAVWNGNYWTNLAAGLDDGNSDATVNALLVSGTTLFAAGYFEMSDTNAMTNIAKWNGTTWSPVGLGINYTPTGPDDTQVAYVNALAGNAANLFVGGFFNLAGTNSVTNLSQWTGTVWNDVGAGLDYVPLLPDDDTTAEVVSLALQGTNLYAGGIFNISGATEVDNFAVWNGSTWSMLGGPADDSVNAIIATNNAVYIGGDFTTIDSVAANGMTRWTNSHWEPLSAGFDGGSVDCLTVTSSNLFAGGSFTSAGGVTALNIARWNNVNWNTLATGSANAPIGDVNTLLLSGSNVYVGGAFDMAGPIAATNVAIWNGSSWTNVGGGVDGAVFALAGNSTNLLVGGSFDFAGVVPATNVARWNGSTWSALGNGLDDTVSAIATNGTNIFIGGAFTATGSNLLNHVAQWNGINWSPISGGVVDTNGGDYVSTLAVSGTNLFVGGNFQIAGTVAAPFIACWNGNTWSALGTNAIDVVTSLAVSGSNLYAGGTFAFANSTNAVARWDGTAWAPVGDEFDVAGPQVAVVGSNVFAAGQFTAIGTNAPNYIAKFDGQTWIPLAGGLDDVASCVAADGTNVFVGGAFTFAGDSPSYHFGVWNDRTPNIWLPPLDGQIVTAGSNLTFSASVAGTQPISYQWFLNGVAIAGATNSTLSKTNVQSADMGNYTLLVSNIYGAVLSDPANVQLYSVVIFSDDFESGTVSNWTTISKAAPLVISTNSHGGQYAALVTNSLAKMYHTLGSEVEGHSMATFWIYDDQGTQTRWLGDVRNYSGGGFGSGTLQQQLAIGLYATNFGTGTGDLQGEVIDTNSYQGQILAGDSTGFFNLDDMPFPRTDGWHKFQIERQDDPTTIDFWIDDDIYREISGAAGKTWDSTTIGSVGSGTVAGSVWFDDIKIEYLDPPDILTNPVSQTVDAGANVTFTVAATGNIRSYQWIKNGALIAGATKSAFTVTNAQQKATYNALVANGIGVSESDDATLTLNDKPTILGHPQSVTVPAGANFALSVTATGSPSNLAYQWRKNGTAIINAVTSDLVFLDCTNSSAGSYTVVITNIAGVVTSAVAVVTITNSRPVITSPPTSQNVNLGGNATFFAAAAGSQPRTYQWRFNGTNIAGATNSFYRRNSVQATNAGSYSVVVSNSFGSVTSALAVLTLNFPPSITTQPLGQAVAAGTNVTLSVVATGTAQLEYQWYAQLVGVSPAVPVALDGETSDTLTIFSPDSSDAGTYSVLVYNLAGHVMSSNATLVVNGPPVVLDDPQDITVSAGSNAVFAVNAVGKAPVTYQWTRNGANIALATNTVYVRTNVQPADVGLYAVTIANSYGSVTSGSAVLSLDSFSVFFDNFESGLGNWTTVSGARALTNSIAQVHSGTNSAACNSSAGKMFHNLSFAVEGHARATFWIYDNNGSLSNWFGEMRSYVGSTNGKPAQILGSGVFTYPFPTNATGQFIGLTPDTNNYQGYILSGYDSGYFDFGDPSAPLRTNGWHQFVMERNADETTISFSVDGNELAVVYDTTPANWDSVFIGSAGKGNTNGSVWFDDIKVEYLDPPVILSDPADASVNPGQGAFFSVSARGNVNGYQWLFNGAAIANATNTSYTIAGAQTNNAGFYSAIAINGVGATQSNPGLLTIVPYPPTLTFAASSGSLHFSVDQNSTIFSSTNLVDWVAIGTNLTNLDVPLTNKVRFFKAGVATYP